MLTSSFVPPKRLGGRRNPFFPYFGLPCNLAQLLHLPRNEDNWALRVRRDRNGCEAPPASHVTSSYIHSKVRLEIDCEGCKQGPWISIQRMQNFHINNVTRITAVNSVVVMATTS